MPSDNKLRILLVDDEMHARNELNYLLSLHENVCVCAEAASVTEGLAEVEREKPDVVFVDVEMPGLSGLLLAETFAGRPEAPLLVFATAHEEFAARAFDLNAVDYVLKPFSQKRIERCLEKLLLAWKERKGEGRCQCPPCLKEKLAIEDGGKTVLVNAADILLAQAANNQVHIHTREKSYATGFSLNELQERLSGEGFFRSHRGYLINLRKVKEIIPWFNGTYNVTLEDLPGTEIPVSRQQAGALKRIFGL